MRHAYGDHIARYAGIRNAQFLLGHAGIATTETYVGQPTLEELAAAVEASTLG
jgi:site-specific recombinase XerD